MTLEKIKELQDEGIITRPTQLKDFKAPRLQGTGQNPVCAYAPPGTPKLVNGCPVYPHFG